MYGELGGSLAGQGPVGRASMSLRDICRVSGRKDKKCMVLRLVVLGMTGTADEIMGARLLGASEATVRTLACTLPSQKFLQQVYSYIFSSL